MNNSSSQAQNHLKKGVTLKAEPVRDLKPIQRIKKILPLSPVNTESLRIGVVRVIWLLLDILISCHICQGILELIDPML